MRITHFSGYPNPIQRELEHIDLSKLSAQFYTKFESMLFLVHKPLNLGYNPDWWAWTPGQMVTIQNTARWLS